MSFIKSFFYVFLGFCLILLFFTGGLVYEGSFYIYSLFSLVFCGLLVYAIFKGHSLGYKFLAIFLWLGFWLKLVAHLLLAYGYREPVGLFDYAAKSWDLVLLVSATGGVAVIMANVLFDTIFLNQLIILHFNIKRLTGIQK